MKSARSILVLASCLVALLTAGFGAQEVITFGTNTATWNLTLRTTATRGSCSWAVDTCLRGIDNVLKTQHTSRFYLNLVGTGQQVANLVEEYSVKSPEHPGLYEIGMDDFYSYFRKWCKADGVAQCTQQLTNILHDVKSGNPKLRWGITLYDDKLKLMINDKAIPSTLRAKFDTIHFYLHFRQNVSNLPTYVATLKKAFPNAKIIVGLYPYDRVDYLPCKQGGTTHCSPANDKALFVSALKEALALSKSGQIAGIEFYPGNFGNVSTWKGWKNKKVCTPTRKSACIQNTEAMHNTAATIIEATH